MDDKLHTLDEIAVLSRISLRTLQTLIATGRGPITTKIGGRRFVREDHRAAWVDQNAQHSGTEAA